MATVKLLSYHQTISLGKTIATAAQLQVYILSILFHYFMSRSYSRSVTRSQKCVKWKQINGTDDKPFHIVYILSHLCGASYSMHFAEAYLAAYIAHILECGMRWHAAIQIIAISWFIVDVRQTHKTIAGWRVWNACSNARHIIAS